MARRLAVVTGWVAQPSARGIHRQTTPLMGGVAIFAAFVLASAVAAFLSPDFAFRRFLGYFAGATVIFVMGVIDDRLDLSWFSKLLGQIVAAVLLLASENAGDILLLTPVGLVLGLFWLVGLTNAMNFLDNMDGLCAGIAATMALAFAVLALLAGQPGTVLISLALAGAAIGFLRFNFHPASIFLGDGGSLFLGYSLASLGVMITRDLDFSWDLLVPVVAVSYPIFDITFVSVTRYLRGQSLAEGGKDHTSHRLARLLGGARPTAFATYLICAATGGLAIVLGLTGIPALTIAAVGVLAVVFWGFGARLCRLAPVPERTSPADAEAAVSGPRVP
ncbi:MAG: undecaprenyl/decaprenyl-phosphate alpha-N-acetylglucosaminyl 1-phosphate transferase [Gemmatimonadetes bacterium]|nr:undecaprenyl/decaprenyl-phosphate alpha-N-acetylglucosaminyl 1-phosphate transferase [Gemmatimonadota bacterium]